MTNRVSNWNAETIARLAKVDDEAVLDIWRDVQLEWGAGVPAPVGRRALAEVIRRAVGRLLDRAGITGHVHYGDRWRVVDNESGTPWLWRGWMQQDGESVFWEPIGTVEVADGLKDNIIVAAKKLLREARCADAECQEYVVASILVRHLAQVFDELSSARFRPI